VNSRELLHQSFYAVGSIASPLGLTALGAENPKCPEEALILDEIATHLVEDQIVIPRIVRTQNNEHAERMKVIAMANVKKSPIRNTNDPGIFRNA
jgi:hypothetical protein